MLRPTYAFFIVVALALAGCKSGNGSLAANGATAALAATAFSQPHAVQTLAFTSGGTRAATPDALDGFLYAKRWLTCRDPQPGLFSTAVTCSFDDAGRTYARANGWTATHGGAGDCARCETWTVPLANARLRAVSEVATTDKTHAVASYAYAVVPTEFGGQLGDWMARNPNGWCGPDPRAAGAWGEARHGSATFEKSTDGWHAVETPSADFAATFGVPVKARACSTV